MLVKNHSSRGIMSSKHIYIFERECWLKGKNGSNKNY